MASTKPIARSASPKTGMVRVSIRYLDIPVCETELDLYKNRDGWMATCVAQGEAGKFMATALGTIDLRTQDGHCGEAIVAAADRHFIVLQGRWL